MRQACHRARLAVATNEFAFQSAQSAAAAVAAADTRSGKTIARIVITPAVVLFTRNSSPPSGPRRPSRHRPIQYSRRATPNRQSPASSPPARSTAGPSHRMEARRPLGQGGGGQGQTAAGNQRHARGALRRLATLTARREHGRRWRQRGRGPPPGRRRRPGVRPRSWHRRRRPRKRRRCGRSAPGRWKCRGTRPGSAR